MGAEGGVMQLKSRRETQGSGQRRFEFRGGKILLRKDQSLYRETSTDFLDVLYSGEGEVGQQYTGYQQMVQTYTSVLGTYDEYIRHICRR
jgi:hypothetical protein